MRGSGHINAAFACVMTFGGVGVAFGLLIWVFSYKIFRR